MSLLPCGTRSRSAGQEHPAHDRDPDEPDEGRNEPRIGAKRSPESAARPRGAAEQNQHNGCNPCGKQRVRDQLRPPEPERPGHDQHRPWERSHHEARPSEFVESGDERVISGPRDRVRESCAYREEQERLAREAEEAAALEAEAAAEAQS